MTREDLAAIRAGAAGDDRVWDCTERPVRIRSAGGLWDLRPGDSMYFDEPAVIVIDGEQDGMPLLRCMPKAWAVATRRQVYGLHPQDQP